MTAPRAAGPPPVGSVWELAANNGPVPHGVWRVAGYDGAGGRVVLLGVRPRADYHWQVLTETFRAGAFRRLPDEPPASDLRRTPAEALGRLGNQREAGSEEAA